MNIFKTLTKFEMFLLAFSITVVTTAFLIVSSGNYLTLIASLIGAIALIFVAKGMVAGQILTVVFAVFYGIISFSFSYYGEMITYLGMTSPIAILAAIAWIKNPYKKTAQVTVAKMSRAQVSVMFVLAIAVTVAFYFILRSFGTAYLELSTLSVTTSFLASYMTMKRSAFYAIGYMANDLILIVLWILATSQDPTYLPMIVCFAIFFLNDLYGFVNWRKMKLSQAIA